MMTQTNTAEIAVAKDSRRAEHDGFDEYDIRVVNPVGEHPTEILQVVEDHVREIGDIDRPADGQTINNFGYVEYSADEVVEVEVFDGYKR